jgi:hypothetical protein
MLKTHLDGHKRRCIYSFVNPNMPKALLGLNSEHKVVVYISRIAIEENVQSLNDAVEHLDESRHAAVIGSRHVPHDRLSPRVHLLPTQRNFDNWFGIADILCHPRQYRYPFLSINQNWLTGVPVVSSDYLVNRLFDKRSGTTMWMIPTRPKLARLPAASFAAKARRLEGSVAPASDVARRSSAANGL